MKQLRIERQDRTVLAKDARSLNYPEVWLSTIVNGNQHTAWLMKHQAERLHKWLDQWLKEQ